jgi:PAS domain-containing protein
MINKIKEAICGVNPFNLDTPQLDKFMRSLHDVRADVAAVRKDLAEERRLIESQLREKEAIIEALIDAIPDMMWYKNMDGEYVYANTPIREGLLCDENPIGKTDVECALAAKEEYGSTNHTFGEKCSNSDELVKESKKPMRFVENGKVRGKHLELEVHKNVVIDKKTGELLGTVGTGRDITEYVAALNDVTCNGKCSIVDIFAKNRFGDE